MEVLSILTFIRTYMQPQTTSTSIAIPVAIVFGFGLIAAAVFFSGFGSAPATAIKPSDVPAEPVKAEVRPLDDSDFVRGNPNAPIVVIEYSDYDCPFCKNFHDTMNTVMDEFAVGGKVAWAYRQFPLEQLHPNAPRISEAAFCVGELGGDEAFWKFSDSIFNEREVNEPTAMSRLPEFAEAAGVKTADFNTCLSSGRNKAKVEASIQEGVAAGAQGTPYSIVMVGDQQAVINGAQPYAVVKQIIENLITQLEGEAALPTT